MITQNLINYSNIDQASSLVNIQIKTSIFKYNVN